MIYFLSMRTDDIHMCVFMQDRTRDRKEEERDCLLFLGVPGLLCNPPCAN